MAEFLKSDDRRLRAQARGDRRRLSRENFETVSDAVNDRRFALENKALQNLRSEALRNAVATLDADSQRLLYLYYWENMSMAEIGKQLGVSKMAVSKRHKKLLQVLKGLVW